MALICLRARSLTFLRSRSHSGLFLVLAGRLLVGVARFGPGGFTFQHLSELLALGKEIIHDLLDLLELIVVEPKCLQHFGPVERREPLTLKHDLLESATLPRIEHLFGQRSFRGLAHLLLAGQLEFVVNGRIAQQRHQLLPAAAQRPTESPRRSPEITRTDWLCSIGCVSLSSARVIGFRSTARILQNNGFSHFRWIFASSDEDNGSPDDFTGWEPIR